MWLSSTLPLCCRRVWCVTGLLLATHFVLLSFGSTFSAVWSSRPQLQAGDGASFISLYMWAMIRLCLIRILMAACYQRSRKWKSSLLVHCPLRTALMRVLCSWMATLLSCCHPSAHVSASRSLCRFLEGRSGLVPTADQHVCAAQPHEGCL